MTNIKKLTLGNPEIQLFVFFVSGRTSGSKGEGINTIYATSSSSATGITEQDALNALQIASLEAITNALYPIIPALNLPNPNLKPVHNYILNVEEFKVIHPPLL